MSEQYVEVTKDELIKSLDDAEKRESALCLKNWDELDKTAKDELDRLIKGKLLQFTPKPKPEPKPDIHHEDHSSMHTDPSINPNLGGKTGKIHGGDPRKDAYKHGVKDVKGSIGVQTRPDGAQHLIERVGNKWRRRVSGASELRSDSPYSENKPKRHLIAIKVE